MLVRYPGNFNIYRVIMFTQRYFVEDMLGYFPNNTWTIALDNMYWIIRAFPFDTWRLVVVDSLLVGDHIEYSMT
jgi:hypothetical protein